MLPFGTLNGLPSAMLNEEIAAAAWEDKMADGLDSIAEVGPRHEQLK